ncbi:MAG TPA: 3-isopropylmalate dehydratase small subunit [Dehalococcoidia bacterium]|jgi:3-isopropylmalate/(R)-2-methylmalate dehydratase small subunit|nr:3-isopropylmalate dehydratase small subunit [Dehalococcoidia bacterium]
MEPISTIHAQAMPLNRADVDTDQIIPAKYLKLVQRSGFGRFLFDSWRKDESFVLNDPIYANAHVLIAGPNFGCGSSREHAPWALQDYGFKAIIAPSFADIFRNNCGKIGLLLITLRPDEVEILMQAAEQKPDSVVEIDLAEQSVRLKGEEWSMHFEIDPFLKHCLLNGLDDISLTLQADADISAFEKQRPGFLPTTV